MTYSRRTVLRGLSAAAFAGAAIGAETRTVEATDHPWSQTNRGPRQTTYRAAAGGPVDRGFAWEQTDRSGTGPSGFARMGVTDGEQAYLAGEGLYALDPTTGEIAWNALTDEDTTTRAPPLVRDETLYYAVDGGEFGALDTANGDSRWTLSLHEEAKPWGLTSRGGTVYVSGYLLGDSSRNGYLAAVDTTEQDVEWEATPADWISPMAVGPDRLFGTVNFGSFQARDRSTGERLWQVEFPSEGIVYAPALGEEGCFVPRQGGLTLVSRDGEPLWNASTQGYGPDSPVLTDELAIVAYTNGPSKATARLTAFERTTGEVRWTVQADERSFRKPVAVGDTVYVGARSGRLFAYAVDSGERRWVAESDVTHPTASLIVGDTAVVATQTGGTVYGLRADGTELPNATVDGPDTALAGREVTFDASGSTDPDGSVERYEWTIYRSPRYGDEYEEVGTATGETLTRTFDKEGRYDLLLRAVDDEGLSARVQHRIDVQPIRLELSRESLVPESGLVERLPGVPFTATFAVRNNGGRAVNATLSLSLPDSLPVQEHTDADGTWTGGGWEWESIAPGGSQTVSLTLAPPENADTGQHSVGATLRTDPGGTLAEQEYRLTIVGEATTVRDQFVGDDGSVTATQVQQALAYWEADQIVGGTGGETVSDQLLLELIRMYRNGGGA
ncbi:PQQ-binding-like beta-propeller repeat protein [Halolamina litorea]|uniref:PQQ-binding-like beta-propeller repeat protein n=1 Tax=Halolamina litorea TaxID=1515593 RepID=A0ABD6BRE9_9EURY|nr:PQQ-binding-like beta-propeller repeat protein [Halolamina litorea]